MARALSLHLHAATRRVDHQIKVGIRAPFTRVDVSGTVITCLRETPYQAELTHFGSIWRTRTEWTSFEAFGASGNPLKIQNLLDAFDLRGYFSSRIRLRVTHGERGCGPVPGIRKSRGGGGWFRDIQTAHEIKMNALVLDGEVPARSARQKGNLPISWDDFIRLPQRSWKVQRKTRRQWIRLRGA